MSSHLKWIRLNAWRFTSNSWSDWARHLTSCLSMRYTIWRMWYSPIWRKTVRCSVCAGTGRHPKYGDECDHCSGKGHVPKWSGYHTPGWLDRLARKVRRQPSAHRRTRSI